MTSSRSRTSRSSCIVLALLAFVAWIALAPSAAEAGRKRVVVLELEGPKAEKFQEDLVKLIKKTHTVIPLDKWNSTAEDLGATGTSEKDLKKVAKKLKVDAIVFGKIDKRRDEYLIKLQVRVGATGKLLSNRFDTKAEGPRIDGEASRNLKDELVEAISSMDEAKTSDEEEGEEEEEKPVKKGFGHKQVKKDDEEEEEEEETPKKKPEPKKKEPKKVAKKKDDEEEDDEEEEKPAKKKKVASSDDEESEEGVSDSGDDEDEPDRAEALSLGERAVDAVLGLSLNRRTMSFVSSAGLMTKPAPYNGVPVAGLYIDGTVFPLAIGHKRKGFAKNLGVSLMYDRVLKIDSKANGVTFPTKETHYAIGLAFRFPIGEKLVIGARLRYGKQLFTISSVDGMGPGIPNVAYKIIDPTITFAYQAAPKLAIDAKLGFMLITDTGQIQRPEQYGAATVSGVEGDIGVSFKFAKSLFARAAFTFETIGFSFKGKGALTDPDGDMTPDVTGARDTYLGGTLALGLLY